MAFTRPHLKLLRVALCGSKIEFDMLDAVKTKTKNDLRIVSLAPSATSILHAVGARRRLVGVTKWCADVADVSGLPRVGDCWHMGSVDEILRLRPSVVIGSRPC